MADPITWYALGRTVEDTESILEAVDAKILTHNLDPSAHGQSGETVYEHRVASTLDHANYSIYNISVSPAARVYKAIVDTGGTGDFVTIQEAVDYVNLHGGGTVFIKSGNHVQNSDIVLDSKITLEGEDPLASILDFNAGNYRLKAGGVGLGTKSYITLKNFMVHGSVSAYAVDLYDADDTNIDGVHFSENTGMDVRAQACDRLNVVSCVSDGSSGYFTLAGSKILFRENRIVSATGAGIIIAGVNSIINRNYIENIKSGLAAIYSGSESEEITDNVIKTSLAADAYGIWVAGNGKHIIKGNDVELGGVGDYGIFVNGVSCLVNGNHVKGCASRGIYVNTDKNSVTGNVILDSVLSIYLSASADYNTVVSNQAPDGITDLGTGNVVDLNNLT